MLCSLYLSKVLKVNHTLTSELTPLGMQTVILFTDIDIKGTVLEVVGVGKGNKLSLDIDKADWIVLERHINT